MLSTKRRMYLMRYLQTIFDHPWNLGMGGLGKTTLAQLIYNDARVKECFGLRSWVYVSDKVDIVGATKSILESVTDESCHIDNLDVLQVKLKNMLKEKKFLIVLDDMWSRSYALWDRLSIPFRYGAHGSKIIVTTRDEDVGYVMDAASIFRLRQLSDDDGWSLFSSYAFQTGSPTKPPHFGVIGRRIVAKCNGLPLAIKTVGSVLRSKVEVKQWDDILNNSIWDLPIECNYILPALRLSYYHLPSHLKRCFAYCSIFPKGYEFEKQNLVLLWIAEGLVHEQPNNNRRIIDLGCDYFVELLSRSFFRQVEHGGGEDGDEYYVMHDLIHDLAQFVAGGLFVHLQECKPSKSDSWVRHVSYKRGDNDQFHRFVALSTFKGLRTFLPFGPSYYKSSLHYQVPRVLTQLNCLRVLSLAFYADLELPISINELRQLRYLDVSHTKIKELPYTICYLCNLQTLLLKGCDNLQKLPGKFWRLCSLINLAIEGTQIEEMPAQMSGLKNLQMLDMFIVGKHGGSTLAELRFARYLGGKLSIKGLHNVAQVDDAQCADLEGKIYLDDLTLEFDLTGNSSCATEREILQNLRPHINLKQLMISGYGGMRFPDWLSEGSFNITSLCLTDCACCDSLPPLGQLPSLKRLTISRMKKLQIVGANFGGCSSMFSSLEEMSFEDMEEWEKWDAEAVQFPNLKKLILENCPKLRGNLPTHLPSLRDITIVECAQLEDQLPQLEFINVLYVSKCGSFEGVAELASNTLRLTEFVSMPFHLDKLSSAKELVIGNCRGLVSLADLKMPSELECLSIVSCKDLKSLHECIMLEASLRELCITDCQSLELNAKDSLPTSLESFEVERIEKMDFPLLISQGRMHLYTSLVTLTIENDVGLESFPLGVVPKLRDFTLIACKNLQDICIQEGVDPDSGLMSLHKLRIRNCPRLEFVARGGLHASNLETLHITDCGSLKSFPPTMHIHLTSLKDLFLERCPMLQQMQEEDDFPSSLIRLSIDNYEQLTSLWTDKKSLHRFRFLEELWLNNCTTVEHFPERGSLPSTLQKLCLNGFPNLRGLDGDGLQSLTNLQKLEISECAKLLSLPEEGLPLSVQSLRILKGHQELKERCQKDKGRDWPKISHIKIIDISDEDETSQEITESSTQTGARSRSTTLSQASTSYLSLLPSLLLSLSPPGIEPLVQSNSIPRPSVLPDTDPSLTLSLSSQGTAPQKTAKQQHHVIEAPSVGESFSSCQGSSASWLFGSGNSLLADQIDVSGDPAHPSKRGRYLDSLTESASASFGDKGASSATTSTRRSFVS
ncbi:hypothetical protein Ancab_029069 [Ancistrocladus abbreviatus]